VNHLQEQLVKAREKRGWTHAQAAAEIGVHHFVLRNLEGGNPQRRTSGADVKLETAVRILSAYFPDLHLSDFLPACGWILLPEGNAIRLAEPRDGDQLVLLRSRRLG